MTNRRSFLRSGAAAAWASSRAWSAETAAEVVIYGATPAGIAAAIAAAGSGRRVLLAEPTDRIGGLTASGLSHPDFRTFEAINGAFYDFTQRVLAHYRRTYGSDSKQAADCLRGTHAEPGVNLQVFEQMLGEHPRIRLERGWRLASVQMQDGNGMRRIASAVFAARSARSTVRGSVFIDATYEGDLLAMAGVAFRTGREAQSEYKEPLAPENADNQLQAYNFRLSATKNPGNRIAPVRPAGYRREDFAGILPILGDGRIKSIFGYPVDCVYKAQIPVLPNGKYDINDVSHAAVRLSLPGENLEWPEGNVQARQRIFDRHVLWNTGLLWFLQNDDKVPEQFRTEARQWGWCKDEFTASGHLPPQLYVREARRMTGVRVFTENDTANAPGDVRAVLQRDSIAMCDYGPNCHGTAHEGALFGGRHTGEFYKPVMPYQVPYGTMLPREVANLLAPVAVSSSHVGFCALRFEPVWMSLGQAAGFAASIAHRTASAVQRVPVADLQRKLWRARGATIYFSDIAPAHQDFEAAQWWGTAGGFHGLVTALSPAGQRGKHFLGQYFETFPYHAAGLAERLDEPVRKSWSDLARAIGISAPSTAATRGEWIRQAWLAESTRKKAAPNP